MILITSGDSHTYGYELVPSELIGSANDLKNDRGFDEYRMTHNWPFLLGKRIGARTVVNLAKPGMGNQWIASSIVEWIDQNLEIVDPSEILVIVGWSNPGRFDFYDTDRRKWDTCLPMAMTEKTKVYFQHFYSDTDSYRRHMSSVIMLQMLLDRIGIRYFMFNAMESTVEPAQIQGRIYDRFLDRKTFYEDISMIQHCKSIGCKVTAGGHLLADGYQVWASVITDQLIERGCIPPG